MSKLELVLDGFIQIACGIVQIMSFGTYSVNWEMDWCAHCTIAKANKKKSV